MRCRWYSGSMYGFTPCTVFFLFSLDVTMTLQAKAGQAYDSAAQGAKQAQDYTQVCGAHAFCPGTITMRCEGPACKRTVVHTADRLWFLQDKAGRAYDSAQQGAKQAGDYTQVRLAHSPFFTATSCKSAVMLRRKMRDCSVLKHEAGTVALCCMKPACLCLGHCSNKEVCSCRRTRRTRRTAARWARRATRRAARRATRRAAAWAARARRT